MRLKINIQNLYQTKLLLKKLNSSHFSPNHQLEAFSRNSQEHLMHQKVCNRWKDSDTRSMPHIWQEYFWCIPHLCNKCERTLCLLLNVSLQLFGQWKNVEPSKSSLPFTASFRCPKISFKGQKTGPDQVVLATSNKKPSIHKRKTKY